MAQQKDLKNKGGQPLFLCDGRVDHDFQKLTGASAIRLTRFSIITHVRPFCQVNFMRKLHKSDSQNLCNFFLKRGLTKRAGMCYNGMFTGYRLRRAVPELLLYHMYALFVKSFLQKKLKKIFHKTLDRPRPRVYNTTNKTREETLKND